MSSNNLNRLLRDPIYIVKIANKVTDEMFDGQHKAIINKELWKQVQDKLGSKNNRGDVKIRQNSYLLHNKIVSADGIVFKNMKTTKTKNKLSYRYYIIPNFYLSAGDIDNITREVVQSFLNSDMNVLTDTARMSFKQTTYSDKLIKHLISKIIYRDNILTYFIKIDDLEYLKSFMGNTLNTKAEKLKGSYLSEDKKYLIIDKHIVVQKGVALLNQYSGKGTSIITRTENANALIRALSIAWKYNKMYEAGISTDEIIKSEKIASRTVYKYINLAYLSPKIINSIMESEVPSHINLQKLFEIGSKYDTFGKQEKTFYC